MYLKNIEVQGFKSFANRMNFEFHNGITAIVGPNGSGKSNVSDAVRWVLGEQSAKQLRGANMQDIIFAGTENRKPLSYAYVAITLDNADHVLPVEYEEVTVARRVYRSGESEYLINGSACRLKDVQELFYDTGIGKEGYSIIGQGQIEKILSGKPEERRELFDEAAGIVKYKRRKAAAVKRLENERENLVRISDILQELKRQVGPLEAQAVKAKEYLQLKEELKTLDINQFLVESDRLENKTKELLKVISITEEELAILTKEGDQVRFEYTEIENKLEELEREISVLKEITNQNSLQNGKMEGQIQVLKEQIKSAEMSDEIYSNRANQINREKQEKEKEKQKYDLQKQDLSETLSLVNEKKSQIEEELNALRYQIEENKNMIEQGKVEIIEQLNKKSIVKSSQQRFDTLMEHLTIRKAQLTQRMLQRKSEEKEREEELDQINQEKNKVIEQAKEQIEKESGLENQLVDWKTKQNQLRLEKESSTRIYHQLTSRLDSLKNIAERYDGYGNSIRKVMEQKEKETGLVGVVSDLIKVDKKFEIAIETALGGRIQNIVTKDEETAKRMIRFLKENKYGRATFLPITAVGSRGEYRYPKALSEPGVIGLADHLVEIDAQFFTIASSLLGNIIVVDHIDSGVALAKKFSYGLSIVTLEGESINAGGAMTGGAFKNSSNLLGRNREIEELEKLVLSKEEEMKKMQFRLEEIEVAQTLLSDELEEVKLNIQSLNMQEHIAETKRLHLIKVKEEETIKISSVTMEQKEIDKQMKEITSEKEESVKDLDALVLREQEIEQSNQLSTEVLEELLCVETRLTEKNAEILMEVSGIEHKKNFVDENTSRMEKELLLLNRQLEELSRDLLLAKEGVEEKQEEILTLASLIKDLENEIQNQQENIKEKVDEKDECTKKQKRFFQHRETISDKMTILEKERFRLHSQLEKMEELKSESTNYLWEEYELTPHIALEMKNEEIYKQEDLKAETIKIKDRIRKLGDVNVNAIEDYKEVSSRYEFLLGQHNDLVEAEGQLLLIIEELDTGMRKQFSEKFAEIQREFDKAFKELFGGGKGSVELIEGEDLLLSGIRIIAQPPGKKLQNMVLLSGGEKALTAISLLFAIQNLKPSPFCLLDEIEAALDDSNVGRFADYLHKLTKNTQFIVITHRRGTMAASDRLYGITMQEKGVSTMVSVNLIEHELTK